MPRLSAALALSLLALLPRSAHASTFPAASCSRTDVNTAIGLAADGDTVTIPAGTCAWASQLAISGKEIILQGAGAGTRAQCGAAASQSTYTCIIGTVPLLQMTYQVGNAPRITGITFRTDAGTSGCSTYSTGAVSIRGTNANFRFDHNRIDHLDCGGLTNGTNGSGEGYVRGVIDHNAFVMGTTLTHSIVNVHNSWGGVTSSAPSYNGAVDNSWAQDPTIGTADAMYVETNTFTHTTGVTSYSEYFVDDQGGARVVYRENTLTNGTLQTHVTLTGGRMRSARHIEWYRNHFTQNAGPAGQASMTASRGGTFMSWDNDVTVTSGSVTRVTDFVTYREDDPRWWYIWGACGRDAITSISRSGTTLTITADNHNIHSNYSDVNIGGATQAEFNVSGKRATYSGGDANSDSVPDANTPITITNISGSTGSATGSPYFTSPWDGNTDTDGYPCLDQVGRGKGDLLSGDEPATAAWPNQALEPVYCLHNTVNGSVTSCAANGGSNITVANRDVYNQDDTNCAPGGGSCSQGVGRGTISQRPSSCTSGVAWFATDEGEWDSTNGATADGKWYRCVASSWTAAYGASATGLPYTYPHPLVSGSASSSGGGIRIYRNRSRPGDDE